MALGGVQGALALDDGLARGRAAPVAGANASNGIPVRHFERGERRMVGSGKSSGDVVCGELMEEAVDRVRVCRLGERRNVPDPPNLYR